VRRLLLALANREGLGAAMERLPLTRRFVRRFVAGRQADDALAVLAALDADGLSSAVTCLGENVRAPADAERATVTYLRLLDAIGSRKLRTTPSLKLTHLGLDLDERLCVANLTRVVERAREAGTRVWIDMESSRYTERTLDLYARLHPAHAHLGCVVQAYLRRTAADVERLVELGATVRLCKGAYHEPPALAYPDKRDVDTSYARLAERLLATDAVTRGVYPGFATHDERLQRVLLDKTRELEIPRDRFEFQMLTGIRSDLHAVVREAGARLRVLVPFGEDWYGYFVRRLAERPANLLFLAKNLVRG
jgi:proline dehydrogenase